MGRITSGLFAIDDLAEQAGGYFALPTEEDIAYTDLLFEICEKYRIHYYSATPKERQFVEEVTRVTYERERAVRLGLPLSDIRPAFAS